MNLLEYITSSKWSVYINGWFYCSGIQFLPDGKIEHLGIEGLSSWLYSDGFLLAFDELGEINYRFKYVDSAKLWISTGEYRETNNNLILACLLTQEEMDELFPDRLSRGIANKSASYKGSDGEIWGYPFFGIDGKIYNYHHENESFWLIEEDKLCIYTAKNEKWLQSISSATSKDDFSSIVLEQINGGYRHFLSFTRNNHYDSSPRQYIKLDISFSNANDNLVIIFNSAGEEYQGFNAKYEFFKLPFNYPVDYVRVAQSAPSRYYLDDMELIKNLVLSRRYKKIVCIGMSIGGYASMWLTEYLSNSDTDTRFYSIAIQAISSLDLRYAEEIRGKFSEKTKNRAKTLICQKIADYEASSKVLDIGDYLSKNKSNVVHYCLFDGLNDFELANIYRLKSDRIDKIAFPLGVNHIEGCYRIGISGVIERLLDKFLWEI